MNYSEKNFVAIGQNHLTYFIEKLGLKNTDRILEIGSGNGRIASALARYIDKGEYLGVDIMKPFVTWCQNAYKNYPNFKFEHIDVFNKHYNKFSSIMAKNYKFRFPDDSFDFIFLTSVFTHMHKEDVGNYLSEIQRMLKLKAICFVTYFLIDDLTLNLISKGISKRKFKKYTDSSYTDNLRVPETAIAFDKDFIESLYYQNKLKITAIKEGKWRDPIGLSGITHNQDRVIAIKA